MSARPRRQAAAKATIIIELSDTEDEENASIDKEEFRPTETKNRQIDRVANTLTNGATRKRWPTVKPNAVSTEMPVAKKRRTNKDKENSGSNSNNAGNEATVNQPLHSATNSNNADNEATVYQALHTGLEQNDGASITFMPVTSRSTNIQDSTPAPSSSTTGRSSFWERRKVWNIHELLAETEHIQPTAARNIVQLFENENTIPFICRYRRDLVDNVTPERLRNIRKTYTDIVDLRKKAENIVNHLQRENVLNTEIREELMCAKTNEELDFLYAPYKPANKGTLAQRAKALGLEKYADCLLYGQVPKVQLSSVVDLKNSDMATEEQVLSGICNIIIHNISRNTSVLEELRRLLSVHYIMLKCSKARESTASKAVVSKIANKNGIADKKLDSSKFDNYLNFHAEVKSIKPHQTLAINRAEKHKFLSVKVETSNQLKCELLRFITDQYMTEGLQYPLRREVFNRALEECYTKKLNPLLCRQVRDKLKEKATRAAIEVFAKNVKQLLLMSPLKGERILGIDPGYTNGCKLALVSETADVLETGVIYPHGRKANRSAAEQRLIQMLSKHKCRIIALGNGTACRDTEMWLTSLFHTGILDQRSIRYSIVNESGASVYSCSEVATKEFPEMDKNEISAVSIARRLNDPLSEYVKIEPRHLGVGMYQHDVNEKLLTETLNDVISECVSYVGVDLNTASLSVLKHIAGLSEKKAQKIIDHRLQKGPFQTRKDLLSVRSIGEKSFVQCAGFIRVEPLTVGGKLKNPLDCTWVHPESYTVAEAIIKKCDIKLSDIGKASFIQRISDFASTPDNLKQFAQQHNIQIDRLNFVLIALQRELLQDYRADLANRPLFKQGLTRLTDLSIGDVLTGAVTNVTHFGAFVDVGVDRDGLIHNSKMNNVKLNIGDRIIASVAKVDLAKKHLSLQLENMLEETETSFAIKAE